MIALLFLAMTCGAHMEWAKSTVHPGCYSLWDGPAWKGVYDPQTGKYRPWCSRGNCLLGESAIPCEPPIGNYGVDFTGLRSTPRYRLNGVPIDREDAHRSISGPQVVPDRSKQGWLTIIGPDDQRKAVLAELDKQGAATVSSWRINDYPPDHWAMGPSGFVTTGLPTIYLQQPCGRVLHRQDDSKTGVKAVVDALRDPVAGNDPAKDPDLRSPLSNWLSGLRHHRGIAVAVVLLLVGGLAIFFSRRKN